jgi:hypothetical protein
MTETTYHAYLEFRERTASAREHRTIAIAYAAAKAGQSRSMPKGLTSGVVETSSRCQRLVVPTLGLRGIE